MIIQNLLGPSVVGVNHNTNAINEILRQNDDYIVALAREKVPRQIASPEVLDLEIHELAQRSRIKLWRVLQKSHITNIKPYIRCIVRSESIDMVRRYKPNLPLPVDEDGELYQGNVLVASSEGIQDPLYDLLQKEMAEEYITQAVDMLRSFPHCQRQIMFCLLKDQVDDALTLTKAFKKFEINIEITSCSSRKEEVIKLKASLSAAHKKLRSLKREQELVQHLTMNATSLEFAQEKDIEAKSRTKPAKSSAEVAAHIHKLEEPYQTAVRLHFLEKCSYTKIAEQLELSVGTVKSHVSRGRKMLAKYWES